MKNIILCMLLVATSPVLAGVLKESSEYSDFYHSLDEQLREPFLRCQLAEAVIAESEESLQKPSPVDPSLKSAERLGISEDVFQNVEELQTPSGLSSYLYNKVKVQFNLNMMQVVDVLEGRARKPDIGDVGSIF